MRTQGWILRSHYSPLLLLLQTNFSFVVLHRFFSHRAFRCSRVTAFVVGCLVNMVCHLTPLAALADTNTHAVQRPRHGRTLSGRSNHITVIVSSRNNGMIDKPSPNKHNDSIILVHNLVHPFHMLCQA